MKKDYNRTIWKRLICFMLSFIMAFSTFVTMTVSNAKYLDIIHIRNLITAYADDEILPQFYREGELVGIYNPDYTSTDTLYYKIGENGTWTEYEVPVAIPTFTTSTVYAKIGENGTVNGDDFVSSKLGIGNYTESTTDLTIDYNNLNLDYSRSYDSKTNKWLISTESRVKILNNNLLDVELPTNEHCVFVKDGNNHYINELNGYSITVTGQNYRHTFIVNANDLEFEYHQYCADMASFFGVSDSYGNDISFILTLYTRLKDGAGRIYEYEGSSYEFDEDEFGNIIVYQLVSLTDPNEHTIVYRYDDENQKLIDVTDQSNRKVGNYEYTNDKLTRSNDKTINYNNDGRVSSIVYDSGESVTYTYNDANKSYTEVSNQGGSTTTVYNDAFLPVSITDETGTTTTYTYDSKYRLHTETTDNVTITYTYDVNGNLTSSVSSDMVNGVNTYYTYYSNGKVKREQCGDDYTYYVYNANGDITVSATLKENYTGTVPAEYDSSLTCFDVTEYTYDSSGRLTEATSDDSIESYTYDQYGNTTSVESEYTVNNETVTTQTDYTYDIMGNVLTSTQDNETTTYTYDEAGRMLLVNDNGKCTRTLYDDYGRVVQEIGPEDYDSTEEGLPSANTYSDSSVGQRYHYNSQNQIDYEINRLNVRTDYTYHNNGVKATEDFDIYNYSYNDKGNVTEIEIDGASTPYATYNYDNTGLVLQSIAYGNGQSVLHEYNNDGKVKKQKYKASANDNPVTQFIYEYGADGELSAKIDLNSDRYTAYSNNTVTVSELVTTVINNETEYSAGALIYSYTDTEEVTENGVTTPATSTKAYNGNTLGITYNENNTAYTVNNSSLFNLTETNDATNHTSATVLKDSGDNTLFSNSYTYDIDGNVTGMTSGGVTTSYAYDNDGRITEYHQGNEAVYYTYDSKGQLIREDVNYTGIRGTRTYTYNSRGNVTQVKNYEYTRGSLDELEGATHLSLSYENQVWVDSINHYGNANSDYYLVYDENGNPIDISALEFDWTNGRELEDIGLTLNNTDYTIYGYTYDDEGIRTQRVSGGGDALYYTTEDGKITSQYKLNSSTGAKEEEIIFIYDGDELISALYGGNTYYYEKNAMGDVMGILNEAGAEIVTYRYDAWGNVLYSNQNTQNNADYYIAHNNPMKYRSYYQDEDTSMYYLQSRYYMPSIYRFLNADIPDIAQQSKGEINGLNLFAYCNNDPMNNVDPTGKYSRNNAVNYAYKYWKYPNVLKYHYYTGGDCANFVSQCLHAGGIKMKSNWYGRYEYIRLGLRVFSVWRRTDSWALALSFKSYFEKFNDTYKVVAKQLKTAKDVKYLLDNYKIKKGDIMMLDTHDDSKTSFNHATLITKITNNDILYTAHSRSRKDQSLKGMINNKAVFVCCIIMLKDGAK